MLCKTAFSVAVERAAKYARKHGCKLKVFVERCDKPSDRMIESYYDDLRAKGMPFAADTSEKYAPLSQAELHETLYEFRKKDKTSPPMQMADLYLWPMCIGGYHPENRPYARLKGDGKLIDCGLEAEAIPFLGIKYSCFEEVEPKQKAGKNPGFKQPPEGG